MTVTDPGLFLSLASTIVGTMNGSEKPRVGLLLCDDVDESAQERHGTYFDMFRNGLNGDRMELVPFRCFEDDPLPDPDEYSGYVISGSRYSVYEEHDWIRKLLDFVRSCWNRNTRVVGICFGHQLLAQALGGKTVKADAGWGFGIHAARVIRNKPWMTGRESLRQDQFNLVVIHQDQVVEVPPMFEVIAQNDFCPNSMMVAGRKMLGIQGHPEFSKRFCRFRADFRKELIGPATHAAALDSLERHELDSPIILKWISNFLTCGG